jgi:hypothetical protein
MNKLSQQPLWERIKSFDFDDSSSHTPFSQKLAHQNKWTEQFARQAIDEYRKFMYLCCTVPGGASPSPVVDEVWHLHLTFTTNYWVAFCQNTLHRQVHHYPSKGGNLENEKHQLWYKQTLEHYQENFGPAPSNIWPGAADVAERSQVQSPQFLDMVVLQRNLLVFAIAVILYLTLTNAYNSKGMAFLLHFVWLAGIGLGTMYWLLHHKKMRLNEWLKIQFPFSTDVFQRTRFLQGAHRAYQTALLDLCNANSITAMEYSFGIANNFEVRPNSKNVLEIHLLTYFIPGETFTYQQGFTIFNSHFQYHDTMEHIHHASAKTSYWQWLPPVVVVMAVLVRLVMGIANQKPVAFLLLGIVLLLLLATGLNYYHRNIKFVRQVLSKWWHEKEGNDNPLLFSFAKDGGVALAGIAQFTVLSAAFAAITPMQRRQDSYGSDGCGSGVDFGGGDSGCGGDGGGGCGGCGGD